MENLFVSLATLSFLVGLLEGEANSVGKNEDHEKHKESDECKCRKITLLPVKGKKEPSSSSNMTVHQEEKD